MLECQTWHAQSGLGTQARKRAVAKDCGEPGRGRSRPARTRRGRAPLAVCLGCVSCVCRGSVASGWCGPGRIANRGVPHLQMWGHRTAHAHARVRPCTEPTTRVSDRCGGG